MRFNLSVKKIFSLKSQNLKQYRDGKSLEWELCLLRIYDNSTANLS